MERKAWLVWNKAHSWRVYMPNANRGYTRKPIPFGANRLPVPITSQKVQPGEFAFPVHLKQDASKNWDLPPLVGIITSKHPRRPGFRGNRENFQDLIVTGRRLGVLVCVIIPDSMNEMSSHAIGFTRHPTLNRWLRLTFPLPDVVYNRIPDREAERRPAEQAALRFIRTHERIALFNPRFFDKQELFHWLAHDHTLSPFLPKTEAWHNKQKLLDYITQFGTVYIKPTRGKAGAGIMRVRKEAGHYRLTCVTGKAQQLVQYRTRQPDRLYLKINQLVRGQSYLIQQGISLARDLGRPFDLRLLVQKNHSGHWGVTGLGIRIAGAKGITTHVPRGGRIGDAAEIFPRVFGSHAKKMHEQAKRLAILVAKGIERQSGQTLGEISLDIGIDQNRQLWLFEANAKPMKFDEPRIRKRSLERIIEYSKYLSERGNPHVAHP